MGERRCAYRKLGTKPERKSFLADLRLRWEGNFKMAVKELGWDCSGLDLYVLG